MMVMFDTFVKEMIDGFSLYFYFVLVAFVMKYISVVIDRRL